MNEAIDRMVGLLDVDGNPVYTYDYIQSMRDKDRRSKIPNHIFSQKNGQENMLSSNADITIGGGSRGGSKSWSILLDAIYDIRNPNFNAIILRHEKPDLKDIIKESAKIYKDYGYYVSSDKDMHWNFKAGGSLEFSYHGDDYDDFKIRFQGKQYSYIAIDEITHITFDKFKYLSTCNRNGSGIRNRIFGSCNPDPDSWVAKFISWWINPNTGTPIPERDGMVRYCFFDGDDVSQIIWGDTRDEVFDQCKDKIMAHWKHDFSKYGDPKDLFVLSVCFTEAKLEDNIKLMESDPAYLAKLLNQSDEQIARDLDGNWLFKASGDDFIKQIDMERFFKNPYQYGDKVRRCSIDIAFEGGDSLVMWLWIGNHIEDVFVCRADSQTSFNNVKSKLKEWRVLEENVVYDLNGVGQSFKGFFKRAVPFNNRESVAPEKKGMYDTIKSESAYLFGHAIRDGRISINERVLDERVSGKGFDNLPIRQVLLTERKAIRKDVAAADKGWVLISKQTMKKIVHHSPDYIESLLMMMLLLEIKSTKKKSSKPIGSATYSSSQYGGVRSYGTLGKIKSGKRPRIRYS